MITQSNLAVNVPVFEIYPKKRDIYVKTHDFIMNCRRS